MKIYLKWLAILYSFTAIVFAFNKTNSNFVEFNDKELQFIPTTY